MCHAARVARSPTAAADRSSRASVERVAAQRLDVPVEILRLLLRALGLAQPGDPSQLHQRRGTAAGRETTTTFAPALASQRRRTGDVATVIRRTPPIDGGECSRRADIETCLDRHAERGCSCLDTRRAPCPWEMPHVKPADPLLAESTTAGAERQSAHRSRPATTSSSSALDRSARAWPSASARVSKVPPPGGCEHVGSRSGDRPAAAGRFKPNSRLWLMTTPDHRWTPSSRRRSGRTLAHLSISRGAGACAAVQG
jgi:hypothetical protein